MSENQRPRILLVDDETANIQVLNENLKAEYETHFALNGRDALEIAGRTHPDLILLDVMMPGMSGFEVREKLLLDPATKSIPVIFVTALGMPEHETRGLELGAVDYITKPIHPGITRLRVRNQLELKQQRDLLVRRNEELEKALGDIRTLIGLLPICAWCRKVRDDKGYWENVEVFLTSRLDACITHSICPECTKKHFSEIMSKAEAAKGEHQEKPKP